MLSIALTLRFNPVGSWSTAKRGVNGAEFRSAADTGTKGVIRPRLTSSNVLSHHSWASGLEADLITLSKIKRLRLITLDLR